MQTQLDPDTIYQFLKDNDHQFRPLLSSRVNLKDYAVKLATHAVHFILQDKSSGLFAFAAVYFNDFRSKKGFISYINVDRSHQSKGYGRLLMDEIILYGKNHGFKILQLEVSRANTSAISFYQQIGFTSVSSNDDAYFLQLTIKDEKG